METTNLAMERKKKKMHNENKAIQKGKSKVMPKSILKNYPRLLISKKDFDEASTSAAYKPPPIEEMSDNSGGVDMITDDLTNIKITDAHCVTIKIPPSVYSSRQPLAIALETNNNKLKSVYFRRGTPPPRRGMLYHEPLTPDSDDEDEEFVEIQN